MSTYKIINYTEFKNNIKDKMPSSTVIINPYFNLERHSAKTIHIVEGLDTITEVTYRGKKNKFALLIPHNPEGIKQALQPHYDALKRFVRVDAPVISVFNTDGRKIAQLSQ